MAHALDNDGNESANSRVSLAGRLPVMPNAEPLSCRSAKQPGFVRGRRLGMCRWSIWSAIDPARTWSSTAGSTTSFATRDPDRRCFADILAATRRNWREWFPGFFGVDQIDTYDPAVDAAQ